MNIGDIDKTKTCFFTGHRQLPDDPRLLAILSQTIQRLIDKGIDTFIAGGATGFDMLSAEEVLRQKATNPKLRLVLFLPCYNYFAKWSWHDQNRLVQAVDGSDMHVFITKGPYTRDCMKKRNYAMVDFSDYGIAYLTNEISGTGQTVRYASRKGISCINISLFL